MSFSNCTGMNFNILTEVCKVSDLDLWVLSSLSLHGLPWGWIVLRSLLMSVITGIVLTRTWMLEKEKLQTFSVGTFDQL